MGEYGAKVYFLAPKLDQADLVYDAFYQIVQADDELESITKKRRSDIYIKEFNTSVKKIAFNSKSRMVSTLKWLSMTRWKHGRGTRD